MILADKKNSDIASTVAGLSIGAGAGYWQFRKMKSTGTLSHFKPVLDPRANILNRIHAINVDSAFNRAVRKYNVNYIQNKLDELEFKLHGNRYSNLTDLNASILNANTTGIETSTVALATERKLKTTQLFRHEWEAAVKATFPNPLESKIFNVVNNDPINAIRSTLTLNPSVLMERAFFTFQKNVGKALGLGYEGHVPMMPVFNMIKELPTMSQTEVVNALQDTKLQGIISHIETVLDKKLRISRRGAVGSGELLFTIPGRNKPIFTIAESFAAVEGGTPGLIRTGAGLHNIYAPGIFGIANETGDIVDELTYSQFKAQKILDTILSNNLSSTSPNLVSYIKDTEAEVAKLADYMEPNISGRDYSLETIFKSHQMTVLDQTGKPVTGQLRRDIASRMYNKTGGAFTPAGSEARFSTLPESHVYGPFGAEHDFARKPWQFIRQYTPTPEAQALNAASPLSDARFNFLDSPLAVQTFNGPSGARAKTLYLSDEQIHLLRDDFGITIGDGELLLHESMKKKLAVSRIKRININELNSDVAQKMINGGYRLENLTEQVNMRIPVEGILGRNPEGSLVSTRYPTEIIGISPTLTKKLDKSTITSLDLITKERIEMTDIEKVFGGLKGLARFVSGDKDKKLGQALQSMGISLGDLEGVQAIARVGDLKDVARQKQALVSHWALGNHSAGAPGTTEVVEAIKDLSMEDTEKYFSSLAQQYGGWNFSLKEGGIAVSQLHFGGEAELTGAGNIGTIEPRIFTLLAGSNPGGEGEAIGSELLERMIRWSPGKITMHEELMKTMESLNGTLKPSGLILEAADVADRSKVDELLRRGGFVKTGVDQVPHMYVPGWETVPELHPRMVSTGAVVETSEPSKIFKDILRDIRSHGSTQDTLTTDEFLANFRREKTGYLTRLLHETAIAGKGAGTLARGELAGSRSLRVVSEVNPANHADFETVLNNSKLPTGVQDRVIGLPVNQAGSMFEEMKLIYGSEAIADMQKRFMSGEMIAGMAMRHPTIGAYSMQPVLMKAIKTDLPAVIIPERTVDLTLGGVTKRVQTGILPGMAADKDADTALAIMLSPGMEAKMRAQLIDQGSVLSNQIFGSYRDHSIRMQLLKPKASQEAITLANYAERRAAETTKLALTAEEVGKLSTSLTRSRVAIMASNLPDERKLTGLSLLEWLEQQPISGKHIGVSQALSGLFEEQMQAVQLGAQGNPKILTGAIASMLENTDKSLSPLLPLFGEGMESSQGFISGFKALSSEGTAGQTIQDITNTIQEFRALPSGAQLAAASRYSAPSAGTSLDFDQLSTMIMANRTKAPSAFAEESRGLLASINRELSTVVNRARPFMKPLVVGATAAGAALTILSPSPGSLPAPPEEAPRVQLTNRNRDDIEIPTITRQTMGSPTANPLLAQRRIEVNTPAFDRRKSVRARIQASGITEEQRQQMVSRMNSRYPGSQINVRIHDDRKSLNPQAISDILSS